MTVGKNFFKLDKKRFKKEESRELGNKLEWSRIKIAI